MRPTIIVCLFIFAFFSNIFCQENMQSAKYTLIKVLSQKPISWDTANPNNLDKSGSNVGVSTWDCLDIFDYEPNNFTRFVHDINYRNSISNDEITCLYFSSKNQLWIGINLGLNRYNYGSGNFIVYKVIHGLSTNVICGILEDNNLCTYKALCRMNTVTLIFTTYSKNDRLQWNCFNLLFCYKMINDNLYFVSKKGITCFCHNSIYDYPVRLKLQISVLKLFDRSVFVAKRDCSLKNSVCEADATNLIYYGNLFTLEYVRLGYSSSSRSKYRNLLYGDERNWIDTEVRSIIYENATPLNYKFISNVSRNEQNWELSKKKLYTFISPVCWQTTWLKILLVSFILFLSFGTLSYRFRTIKHQKRELDIKVKERTREAIEQKEKIELQAEEIKRMNTLLKEQNKILEEDVHKISFERVMLKRVSFEEFKNIYPDDNSCYDLIRELKSQTHFRCKNCRSEEYYLQKGQFLYRCKKCGYRERLTYGTIFYRIKFPIVKAFYILYLVSTGQELNMKQLANMLALRWETCWSFKNKVVDVMRNRKRLKNLKEGWKELIVISKS